MGQFERRESSTAIANPLGLAGIEFIEYSSPRPQALGQVLETMGFRPVARHRSREVLLYRQGDMNVVINAHQDLAGTAADTAAPPASALDEPPRISAMGLRVRDAAQAYAHALDRGAWAVPSQAAAMELNIPAIHGVGASRIYLVDRWRAVSIWDVDFVPIPTVDVWPPALAGLHWFGLVQYIGRARSADWVAFYRELFGFAELPAAQRFGILPKGRILQSPCRSFYLQLVEPEPGLPEADGDESLQRLGLGTPDVPAAVRALAERGVAFVEEVTGHGLPSGARGALTKPWLGGLMFELVPDQAAAEVPA